MVWNILDPDLIPQHALTNPSNGGAWTTLETYNF